SFDQTIRVWDLHTGAATQVLHGHTGDVSSISVSPDGTTLVSAAADRTVRFWHTATWEQSKLLERHKSNVYRVLAAPDGARLACCSKDGCVLVWTADGVQVSAVKIHKSKPGCVCWSHNSALLAITPFDGAIRIEGTGSRVLEGHTGLVRSAVF